MNTGRFLLFTDWIRTAAAEGVGAKRKPLVGARASSCFSRPAAQSERVADWPLSTRRCGVASWILVPLEKPIVAAAMAKSSLSVIWMLGDATSACAMTYVRDRFSSIGRPE